MTKEELLSEVDALVERIVDHYKSDWYDYDRPRAEDVDAPDFLLALRSTGVDTFFMDTRSISYINYVWCKGAYEQNRAERYYRCNLDGIKKISVMRAGELFDKIFLPQKYIEYEEESYAKGRVPMSLYEWTIDRERKAESL